MKTNVIILCHRFLDQATKEIAVGGVETYAYNLVKLNIELGHNVTVFQLGEKEEVYKDSNFTVSFCRTMQEIEKKYLNVKENYEIKILLSFEFGHLVKKHEKTIIVQHGVEFDGFTPTKSNSLFLFLQKLKSKYEFVKYKIRLKKILENSSRIVCVDLNFINYVRIFQRFERYEEKLKYIPNFAELSPKSLIDEKIKKDDGIVRIIIPRRFEYHRGILLYADVAEKLIHYYNNIQIDFIGNGTYEEYLKNRFSGIDNVRIYKASHFELLEIYRNADICVIPTLYSEGTSLSAIEAMANGCSVIVSNIGGLGNLVIPNYNGIICEPTEKAFFKATSQLIENTNERKMFILNAYKVVENSFSLKAWKQEWTSILS